MKNKDKYDLRYLRWETRNIRNDYRLEKATDVYYKGMKIERIFGGAYSDVLAWMEKDDETRDKRQDEADKN